MAFCRSGNLLVESADTHFFRVSWQHRLRHRLFPDALRLALLEAKIARRRNCARRQHVDQASHDTRDPGLHRFHPEMARATSLSCHHRNRGACELPSLVNPLAAILIGRLR